MKSKILLSALVLSMGLFASTKGLTKDEVSSMTFFNAKGIKVLNTLGYDSFTEASVLAQTPQGPQKVNVFVTNDKKFVFIGAGFNSETGETLQIPVDIKKYASNAAITIGSGTEELYIFTDPECPYCQKLDKEVLETIDLKKYKVFIYLYPLSFHANAEAMSLYIMAQKTNKEKINALHEVSNGKTNYQNFSSTEKERTALKKELEVQKNIATELGVSGTPTVFSGSGVTVDWGKLAQKPQLKQIKK